ncbi:mRNA-capping enzyme [Fulvia fulva]|nr:mRNA-capping enzyme [Fulvia fulva]KAK4628388.1 mRNA-capping enzyme [Fulvia fulva]WPV13699.1 mRNA-capping enzyme [Fulvia fulva]WPV28969.1 mRNA-capping enzyme [Fulvia fulva]
MAEHLYAKLPLERLPVRLQRLLQTPVPRSWILPATLTWLLGLAPLAWFVYKRTSRGVSKKKDATTTDPGLLVKGTRFEQYQTPSGHVYPKIRTFYHEHQKKANLPADLPLLVFMHGLGGSAAQFAPLLTSLVNIAPCLAIDLPGCGRSEFLPKENEAYTTTALAELLFAAIDRFRNKDCNQKVVLVGHSMGCSISALLASNTSPLAHLCSEHVLGMIALCPRSSTITKHELQNIQYLNWIWSPLFDLVRLHDRRGGVDSRSVLRVVGEHADSETKRLQLRFNEQSSSAVFQKVLLGIYLQEKKTAEKGEESLLGKRVWSGMKVPLFLVAAKKDALAPPENVELITDWLTEETKRQDSAGGQQDYADTENEDPMKDAHLPGDKAVEDSADIEEVAPDQLGDLQESQQPKQTSIIPAVAGDVDLAARRLSSNKHEQPYLTTESHTIEEAQTESKHAFALKTTVFPQSSHGLLYASKDVRILASLIEGFLAKCVDERLAPSWQLRHLMSTDKWDVKNLAKWQKVQNCSEPIGGVFRAMKTMREIDEAHNPREFVKKYSYRIRPDGVAMVIDISHDTPVYDKKGLEDNGVEYHKFPTVSKEPPTEDEVEQFVGLVDSLRASPKIAGAGSDTQPTVGVHCHYGFNRTGYFICCYLVERVGWKLEAALKEFAEKRAPGIKHDWFINTLYARYEARIERRGTIVG